LREGRNKLLHSRDTPDRLGGDDHIFNGVAELHTYIRDNQDFIPTGERFRQGERISTAFVGSTVTKW
jgi:hypothetical protein